MAQHHALLALRRPPVRRKTVGARSGNQRRSRPISLKKSLAGDVDRFYQPDEPQPHSKNQDVVAGCGSTGLFKHNRPLADIDRARRAPSRATRNRPFASSAASHRGVAMPIFRTASDGSIMIGWPRDAALLKGSPLSRISARSTVAAIGICE